MAIAFAARQARRVIGDMPVRRTLQLQLGKLRAAGPRADTDRLLQAGQCGHDAVNPASNRTAGPGRRGGLPAATSAAILLYAGHNAAAAGTSVLAGWLSDQRSPRLVFTLGAVAYAAGYLILAVGSHR